jgi:hypothetical protein
MSSIFDVSGNNLPELTSTSSPQEYIQVFRQLVSRKRNSCDGPEDMAYGYNLAIEEIIEELDRLEIKQKFSANTDAIAEFNKVFKLAAE